MPRRHDAYEGSSQSKLMTYVKNVSSIMILGGLIYGVCAFFAPLRTMPDDIRSMGSSIGGLHRDVSDIQKTQALQAQAMQTMSQAVIQVSELRTDFEKHTAADTQKCEQVKQSFDKLEGRVHDLEKATFKYP